MSWWRAAFNEVNDWALSAYNILEDEIYEQGKKLLEKPIDNSKDFEAHKKAKIHYKACMDDDKQNKLGDLDFSDKIFFVDGM